MRRTAAFLLFLAALTVPLPNTSGPMSILAYIHLRTTQDAADVGSPIGVILSLIPFALLLAACAGGSSPRTLVFQVVGSAGMFLLCGWAAAVSSTRLYVAYRVSPVAGLALLSLLESAFYPRRPAPADPDRRFIVSLLLLLAGEQLLSLTLGLITTPRAVWALAGATTALLRQFAYAAGLAAAFLVVAWGLGARQRWSAWIGAATCAVLAVLTLWECATFLTGNISDPAPFWLTLAPFLIPSLSMQTTVAIVLGRRAWESWRRPDELTRMDPS